MNALRYIVMSGIPIARARGQQKPTVWQAESLILKLMIGWDYDKDDPYFLWEA